MVVKNLKLQNRDLLSWLSEASSIFFEHGSSPPDLTRCYTCELLWYIQDLTSSETASKVVVKFRKLLSVFIQVQAKALG